MKASSSARSARSTDVAIIGGGLIGLSAAWRLAARGVSVAVVDPSPGSGASWAAAGMLAPVTEVHPGEEPLLALNLVSAEMYPSFVSELEDETGADVGYRRSGTLLVARDSDDNAALEDLYRYQRELGLQVERLSGRECRKHEPALSPRTRGGIVVPGDHQVDNRALVTALRAACEARGVVFERTSAVAVGTAAGSVSHVDLEDGVSLACGTVVLAAGAGGGRIGGLADAGLPPVRPVKGQLLHLRGAVPLLQSNVRGIEAYLVGRSDGRVVLGATVEEQGFDLRITAGGLHDLLRAGYELVPGITELEVIETVAGSRPATPDNAPLIGATELPGLIVATGHYRNGVLLTPVTAAAVADLVEKGRTDEAVAPFSPSRFAVERTVR
jgi:glycine oxidase